MDSCTITGSKFIDTPPRMRRMIILNVWYDHRHDGAVPDSEYHNEISL